MSEIEIEHWHEHHWRVDGVEIVLHAGGPPDTACIRIHGDEWVMHGAKESRRIAKALLRASAEAERLWDKEGGE
ncbi:MAG: hypothetical protein M0R22_10900 [Dehalococcoidia bacterium]|nr:hypothetical protein [Dehalococcoidia bacterium]